MGQNLPSSAGSLHLSVDIDFLSFSYLFLYMVVVNVRVIRSEMTALLVISDQAIRLVPRLSTAM